MTESPISGRTGRTRGERRIGQAHPTTGPEQESQGRRRRTAASRRRRRGLARGRFSGFLSALGAALGRVFGRNRARRRERPVRLALPPIETAADVAAMLEAITTAVRRGGITPGEAAALAEVADTYIRAIETSDFDRRLRALEAARAAKS
jgi:hypothetical protein